MAEKSLDQKLADIHAEPSSSQAFIIADAKDADMAFGVTAPGRYSPEYHHGELPFKSIHEYRQQMREVLQQGLVDILLMSASSNEVLTIQERLFDNSPVTPAARANDTSDIHAMRGSSYFTMASRPFRTATIDHIQCGKFECAPDERRLGANLGLYSVTFTNNRDQDLEALERFKEFRIEAERKGFRYFWEIFDPNVPEAVQPKKMGAFINDCIARTLAGVPSAGRPIFLKTVYHGPQAMEELVHFDPHLVVGVLGGSAGTTYDAFKLLAEAQKYGARAALYGRKINNAEHQLSFIYFLRMIANGEISAEEAVKAYHGVLQGLGIAPRRSLEDDMQLTSTAMSYAGSASQPTVSGPSHKPSTQAASSAQSQPKPRPGEPDFDKMSPQEKIEYNQRQRDRIFG